MRQRLGRPVRLDALSRRALRTLVGPVCLIGTSVIGAVLLSSWTDGPDLFDLSPKTLGADGYALVAWHELERAPHALRAGGAASGAKVRALGYMMEGSESVPRRMAGRFVLLPSVGHLLHPPHRFGDGMIEVRLRAGEVVRISEGSLVWAWGTLRILPGDPEGDEPLYVLENAQTVLASKADIPKYFR